MANHPLQSSGQISLNDISMEFDRPSGTMTSLEDARNQVYGVINTSILPNPLTGLNSVTSNPKDGRHISDWYGYNYNAAVAMNFGGGFDSPGMTTLIIQPDGKIVVGGSSSNYDGSPAGSIIRLNPDGSRDVAFTTAGGVGFNASVSALALQADDKIFVGGFFNTYNGITREHGVRLNAGGTVDTAHYANMSTQAVNKAFSTNVYGIAIQADGKAVCVGAFTIFNNGTFQHGLIRLNTDGTEDAAFSTNIGAGVTPQPFNLDTFSVAIQSGDSKILVGGTFTLLKALTRNRLVRFNSSGTEDTAFYGNLGTGFNEKVNAITVQPDGKILVGGLFTAVNGVTRNHLVRLNNDGTMDTTFYSNLGTGFNDNVEDIVLQPDGKILVGGFFTTLNGVTRNFLVRLNSTGTLDTTFSTNLGTGFNNDVYAMAVQDSGSIIVVGIFTSLNGVTRNRICQISSTGVPTA